MGLVAALPREGEKKSHINSLEQNKDYNFLLQS